MTDHPHSVDQSDRIVPINLRQSGRTPTELLISTRVRKSPYWHLSHEAGCWRATVYNRVYHPRGYVRPEDGGAAAEHEALTHHVTMWNVAVERQIRVLGPDAERFTNYVITRDATRIEPLHAKYVILCNEKGGILNDPVLLRLSKDEFWFSLADSDLLYWLQGVNVGARMDVTIDEIDVCPVQIQGPKSLALMTDLVGAAIGDIPYYGIMEAEIAGCSVVISQSGFSGEKGYEIYLRDATLNAEKLWNAVLEAGKAHQLSVIAPGHQRRIQAGIMSWGQDIDHETLPFQCNLAYQVPRRKKAGLHRQGGAGARARTGRRRPAAVLDDAGGRDHRRQADRRLRARLLAGVGCLRRRPDRLISPRRGTRPSWTATSRSATCRSGSAAVGTELTVWLPDEYASEPGKPDRAQVCEVPFRPSVNPSARELAPLPRRRRDHLAMRYLRERGAGR